MKFIYSTNVDYVCKRKYHLDSKTSLVSLSLVVFPFACMHRVSFSLFYFPPVPKEMRVLRLKPRYPGARIQKYTSSFSLHVADRVSSKFAAFQEYSVHYLSEHWNLKCFSVVLQMVTRRKKFLSREIESKQ